MRKTVVLGAGGHAKAVIAILKADPDCELVGCVDHNPKTVGSDVRVIGDDAILPGLYRRGIRHAFVAVGDNRKREELARRAEGIGFTLISAVSPAAYIADSVRLAGGVAVMPGAVLNADVRVGSNAIVNSGAIVDHDGAVGALCHIAPGCTLSGRVAVGDGAFLGTGTIVIDNIRIGSWSMLGAGSVVVNDIPDRCLAMGFPARFVRDWP